MLGRNLALLLGTEFIAVYPDPGLFPLQYKVLMNVERFDGELGDEVLLRIRWLIVSTSTGEALTVRYETFREPMASRSYENLVEAYGQLLARLSRAIAATIRELELVGDEIPPEGDATPEALSRPSAARPE